MYGVTPTGFVTKPLATIREEIEDAQRLDIDPGLDLDDRSVLGQLNGIFSAHLASVWELGAAVYASQYPDSASGDSLDNVSSITGTRRSKTTKTTVAGVLVTLNPNAALPAGSVASLTSQPNSRFLSAAEVPADPAGGVFPVDFVAEAAGAIVVTAGELDTIAEPVVGWTAVDNPTAGVTGQETETDAELRTKRLDELESTGSTNVDAIRASLNRLDSVVDSRVFENDTDFVDAAGRPPHSVQAILRGGDPAAIAQSIFEEKAGGIATVGAQSLIVIDSQGFPHTIRWDDGTQLLFFASMTVTTDPQTFDPVGGPDAIKAAVAAYINALGIGDDVIYDVVKAAVLPVAPGCGVPGVVKIDSLLIGFGAATEMSDLPVAVTEYATSDVANVAVVVA